MLSKNFKITSHLSILFVTCRDVKEARLLSQALLKNWIAACVNIIPKYECPAIEAIQVAKSDSKFLKWVERETIFSKSFEKAL